MKPVLIRQDSQGHRAPLLSDDKETDRSAVDWPRSRRTLRLPRRKVP